MVELRGSCRDLKSAGLSCEERTDAYDPEVDYVTWLREEAFELPPEYIPEAGEPLSLLRVDVTDNLADIMTTEDDDASSNLVVFDDRGVDIDVPALKQTAFQALPRGATIVFLGAGGNTATGDQALWALLFGIVAITVMAIAAALSGAVEFLRHGKALAPLTVLTGGFGVFRTGAAWAVSLPLCLAVFVSLVVGTLLAKPIDRIGFISPGLLATVAGITLALSAAMSVWAGQIAVRQAKRWRPSGAD